MNAPATAAAAYAEITCERGLGTLPDSRCAALWREANGKIPGTSPRRLFELQTSKCAGCPHGKLRADAGAHLKAGGELVHLHVAAPAPPTVVPTPPHARARVRIEKQAQATRIPLDEVRARLLARPAAPPSPASEPSPETPEQEETPVPKPKLSPERIGLKCRVCGGKYNAAPTGRAAVVCSSECRKQYVARRVGERREAEPATPKGGGSEARAKRERAPVAERAAPALASGFRVRIGKLEVECATLDALAELVERFGGGHAG